MDVESEIDRLYQLPLEEFTPSRNALARSLVGAASQRVKHLVKPAVPAWVVNQLYWRSRPTYDGLMSAAERFRQVQRAVIEGRKGDVRSAQDAYRAALRDAVAKTAPIMKSAGQPASGATMQLIQRTLEALPKPGEVPGRLTHALEPGGFELLAGVTLRSPSTPEAPTTREKQKPEKPKMEPSGRRQPRKAETPGPSTIERERLVTARRDLRDAKRAANKADTAVATAMNHLKRARAVEAQKTAELSRASQERAALERELEQRQAAAERAKAALRRAR